MCFSGIRQLQLILLKVSLLLGVEVHTGVEFQGLNEPSGENGIFRRQPETTHLSVSLVASFLLLKKKKRMTTTCKAHKSLLCLLKVGRPSCSPRLTRLQPSSLMSLSLLEEAGLSLMVRQTHAFYNPSLAKGRTQRCCKGQNVDTW